MGILRCASSIPRPDRVMFSRRPLEETECKTPSDCSLIRLNYIMVHNITLGGSKLHHTRLGYIRLGSIKLDCISLGWIALLFFDGLNRCFTVFSTCFTLFSGSCQASRLTKHMNINDLKDFFP